MFTSFSTASLYPMKTEDSARLALSLGYRRLEVFINSEYEKTPEYIREFRATVEEEGGRIDSFHPYLSGTEPFLLFSDYERRRRETVETYKRDIFHASELGASRFILHGPGLRPKEWRPPLEHELEVFNELCSFGKECGVDILLENVTLFLSAFPEFIASCAELVPDLKFNLDIKQAYRVSRPVKSFVNVMGKRLENVHISDTDKTGHCRLPGDGGLVDYIDLFKLLDGVGYTGALVTEVYRGDYNDISDIKRAKAFLEAQLYEYSREHSRHNIGGE